MASRAGLLFLACFFAFIACCDAVSARRYFGENRAHGREEEALALVRRFSRPLDEQNTNLLSPLRLSPSSSGPQRSEREALPNKDLPNGKKTVSQTERFRQLKERFDKRSMMEQHRTVGEAFQVPEHKASLRPGVEGSWSAPCFGEMTATLTLDENDVSVTLDASAKLHDVCADFYLLATNEEWYVAGVVRGGVHVEKLPSVTSEALQFISAQGLQVFLIQAGVVGELIDIVETIELFYGPWTESDALAFLKESMKITYRPRDNTDKVALSIDEDAIPDGTFLATQRFDGSEVMIQYGTGSYSGHTTMALRMNGTLHVCESTGKNQPDYWPPPYGVICHPWKTWIGLAQKARYMVTAVPLSAEYQQRWDNAKAEAFVKSNLGYPYGFHNFMFGWIDTPEDNFPPPFSQGLFETMFAVLDHTLHTDIQRVFTDAMNKRLGSNCSSVSCLYDAAYAKGYQTLSPVYVMPEQDRWRYSDGPSMVCDVFLLETYKAAGVFGDLRDQIQATEFTPRDLYTLALFEPNSRQSVFGRWCNTTVEPASQQPEEPVCQIMGPYVAQLPGWNTIQPYAHMCEKCPTLWPDYKRKPGC